jgi:hypothetical protein
MVEKEGAKDEDVGGDSEGYAGPRIRAEKAEQKRFEESRRQREVVSGVRTKIDKSK